MTLAIQEIPKISTHSHFPQGCKTIQLQKNPSDISALTIAVKKKKKKVQHQMRNETSPMLQSLYFNSGKN